MLPKFCQTRFLVATIVFSLTQGVSAADRQTTSSMADIQRFESQSAGYTARQKANIRRTLKLMSITRQRLDSSPNRSDPAWVEADRRYKALASRLNGLLSGASGGTATTNQAGTSAARPSASSAPRPAASASASGAATKRLVSGQRVQLKRLARTIEGLRKDMVRSGPSPLQDGRNVKRYNQRLKQFADEIGRYAEYGKDPDIGAAVTAYQALVADLKQEYARSRQQLSQVGNAQERLASVDAKLREAKPPARLLPPFTVEQAKSWAGQVAATRAAAQGVAKEVQAIAPLAYLPPDAKYTSRKVQSLVRFADDSARKANDAVKDTESHLQAQLGYISSELEFFEKLDPDNPSHRANMFLNEGSEQDVYERLDKQMKLAKSYEAFQRAIGKAPDAHVTQRIARVKNAREQYAAKRTKALGESRLPKPKSTDAARIKVAEQILANPDYKFGQHGPIVLTTEKIVTREKEVSRDTIKDVDLSLSGTLTLSGTRETWKYKWDEFKFATPLRHDDGNWYVWWITAKKFASGWEKTPIGTWVSGKATQGSLILEKNF